MLYKYIQSCIWGPLAYLLVSLTTFSFFGHLQLEVLNGRSRPIQNGHGIVLLDYDLVRYTERVNLVMRHGSEKYEQT